MGGKFHIHGKPGYFPATVELSLFVRCYVSSVNLALLCHVIWPTAPSSMRTIGASVYVVDMH